MAASTSADSNNNYRYDVFISHRAPDVGMTFSSHLYRRLIGDGLRVFLDRKEMRSGEDVNRQIKDAITTASVHVPIFSPRYAESKWCLDELVLLLESGAPIIPVYHNVKPFELRFTTRGHYAPALQKYSERNDSSTIEKWRNALCQVADISGFDLDTFNGDEGELVDGVVKDVLKRLKPEAMAASTSADSNNDYGCNVFISQRGPDVRMTFVSHLYRRLVGNGLRVFLDREEMRSGEDVNRQIKDAITTASVHVPIFSPRYAESNRCLDKLVLMLESGAPIIPVYHNVRPTDLPRSKGLYGESLCKLESERTKGSQLRYDSSTVEKWRNALAQVSEIRGFELEACDGDEGELVDGVAKNVLRRVKPEAMAASTSADSNNDYGCDVFISQRWPDVKRTFASHLYRRLLGSGQRVFLDQGELNSGEGLSRQIEDAITTASVHVPILSRRYADSKWCLDELVLMLESGAPIFPVYHNVTPSDVRLSNGLYAKSLQRHSEKERVASSTIEKWRTALSHVAYISGFELEAFNGDEGELVDKVVESVLRRAKTQRGSAAKHVIGLDEKVEDFEKKVFFKSAKPQVVGIVGVGGVGKTTLARELFDRKKQNYSRFCFLSNVRENARLGFLNSLQRQLLKSLTGKDALINSIDGGKEALKEHLSSCRGVLMIIDDVDQLNQIHALFPVRSGLLSDSLVVITSRDENVIRSSGVENAAIYQLTGLNDQHSQQLFCAYSFNQPNPIQGFDSLVDNFLKALKGLPLFLRVFGALLSGNNNRLYWKQQLDRLQRIPPGETQEILQISYDSLDKEAKQMFLDSACFFIGQKRDTAIRTWEGSGWDGRSGFVALQYKCLLELDSENNIEMHDHLRDFGRALADASLPRRLLHSTAHIKDTLEQLSGTDVRGIKMVLGEDNDDVDVLGAIDVRTLELLEAENGILERLLRKPEEHVPRRLIWLRWNKCPTPSLPAWLPMESLRVLQVSGSKLQTLWEDESQASNYLELRELEINAPLSNIPGSIGRLKHLERFVVCKYLSGHVNLTNLPEEFCRLQSLKALVLTDCSKVKALPEFFGRLRGLQHIDLSFCSNLEMLPNSFICLSQLRHINLSDCHDLMMLPNYFGDLTGLQHIDMRGCHNLERLPDFFAGDLRDLRHINLSGCHDLQRLPDSFGELRYLQHIDLQACHNLEKLPDSFGHLKNLDYINLSNCHKLKRMPESFGSLSNLQHIDLSGCHNLERLPNNFRNLKKLKYLDVEGCSNLILDRFEIIEILDNLPVAHRSQLEQLYE